MSQEHDPNQFPQTPIYTPSPLHQDEILDAEIVDDFDGSGDSETTATGRFIGKVVLGILFFGFLVIAGTTIYAVYYFSSASSAGLDPTPLESGPGKWAAIRSCFEKGDIDVSPDELEKIESAIQEMVDYCCEYDHEATIANIDQDAFCDQLNRTEYAALNFLERMVIHRDFDYVTYGPVEYRKFKIVAVESKGDREALVYMYRWDYDPARGIESRWWMHKGQDGAWRLFDWEELRLGLTEVEHYAVLFHEQESLNVSLFYEWLEEYEDARSHLSQGETARAEVIMKRASVKRVHPRLKNYVCYKNAEQWIAIGNTARGLAELEKIQDFTEVPGAHLLKADLLEFDEKYEEAAIEIKAYQKQLGISPVALGKLAANLQKQGLANESLGPRMELAKLFPTELSVLRTLARQMGPDEIQPLIELVAASENPLQLAMDVASSVYEIQNRHVIDALANLVEKQEDNSGAIAYLKGLRADLGADYEKAAGEFLLASTSFESADNQERQSQCFDRYVRSMTRIGKALEAYEKSPSKPEAFETIYEYFEYGEIEDDQMLAVAKRHRENKFNTGLPDLIQANQLLEKGEFDDAYFRYKKLLDSGSLDEDELYDCKVSYYQCAAKSQVALEAYRQSDEKEFAFNELAYYLRHGGDFGALTTLVEEHSQTPDANQADLANFRAELEGHLGNHEKALELWLACFQKDDFDSPYPAFNSFAKWAVRNNKVQTALERIDGLEFEYKTALYSQIQRQLQSHFPLDDSQYRAFIRLVENTEVVEIQKAWWKVFLAGKEADNEAIDDHCSYLTGDDWASDEFYWASNLNETWFNALIEDRNLDAATRASQNTSISIDGFGMPITLAIQNSNLPSLEQALSESGVYYENYPNAISQQFNVAFLKEPRFKRLRKKFPIPSPQFYEKSTSFHLFFKQAPDWNELNSILKTTFVGFEFEEFTNDSQDRETKVVVGHSKVGLIPVVLKLAKQNATLFDNDTEERTNIVDHYVATLCFHDRQMDDTTQLTLASKMSGGKASMAFFQEPSLWVPDWNELSGLEYNELANSLRNGAGSSTRLRLDGVDAEPSWKKRRHIAELFQHLKNDKPEPVEVKMGFSFVDVTETHWFKVTQLKEPTNGSLGVIVQRDRPIQLIRALQPGELHWVDWNEIRDWRIAE